MTIYDKEMKYCKHCGDKILKDAVVCPKCGLQVEILKVEYVSNNKNAYNDNSRKRNKWVAFLLCLFLGVIGAHKFYENKNGMGVLYLLTAGLCGIGVMIDLIALLFKRTYYYI